MATPETFLPRQPEEPRTQRLGMGKNFLWLLAGVGITVGAAFLWFTQTKQAPPTVLLEPKTLTAADLQATPGSSDGVLPFQKGYAGVNREQAPPVQKPQPPVAVPVEVPVVTPIPPEVQTALAGTSSMESPFARQAPKTEEKKEVATKTEETKQTPAPKQAAPPKPPKLWLFAKVEENPLKDTEGQMGTRQDLAKAPASDLIKPARWARAANPVKVLYNTQHIEGSVRQEISSDTPGDVTILVTRTVYDALGQDVPLVPQFSLMKGSYEGSTKYGQTRLNIGINQIQFPDKTIVGLEKARMTDKSGAVGGAGDVDNHYLKLGMAVVLSTVLNVGAQSIAGNTSGYYPTTEQKAAEQLGQGVNQAGQQIVAKQLAVPPTITIHAGEQVGVQFSDNISFSKAPIVIK